MRAFTAAYAAWMAVVALAIAGLDLTPGVPWWGAASGAVGTVVAAASSITLRRSARQPEDANPGGVR